MPTKITLVVDDKTAAGFQSVAKNAGEAEKATGELISKLSSFSRESASMVSRMDRWSAANKKAAEEQDKLAGASRKSREELRRLWKEGRTASQVFDRMVNDATKAAKAEDALARSSRSVASSHSQVRKSSGKLAGGLLEASRGAEDFASQLGPMGLGGALRASSNNISQMAFVMGGPFAGAIAGVGVALGTTLIPMLTESSEGAEEFGGNIDRLIGKLKGLEAARLDAVGTGADKQQESIKSLERRIKLEKGVTDEIRKEMTALTRFVTIQKELAGEGEKAFRKSDGRSFEDRALAKLKREKALRKELNELERQSSAVRNAVIEAGGDEKNLKVIEKNRDLVRDEFRSRLTNETKLKAELKERLSILAKERNDGRALRQEFAKLDDADIRRKRDFAIQQSKSREDLNKALEKTRKKESQIREELERAADANKLDVDKREKGLKKINSLREDELKITRRLSQLDKERLRLQDQADRKAEAANRRKMADAKREHDREVKKAQEKFKEQLGSLQGGLSQSGFGGQVGQIARGISPGKLLRELAESRVGDTPGLSRGKREKAIRDELANIRKQRAAGKLDLGEVRNTQSSLIQQELERRQQRGKVGIGNAFKQSQQNQAASIFGGNVTGQQVQQAQGQLVKSSVSQLGQQNKLSKATVDGLTKAADALNEQTKINAQTEQQLRTINSFIDGVKDSMRRQASQRRGTRG